MRKDNEKAVVFFRFLCIIERKKTKRGGDEMSEKMTTREAAKRWSISERRVSSFCREGRIEGVIKEGKAWYIPIDAEKPEDQRVKSGAYRKNAEKSCLPLPIGISDYRLASTEYYYVDKTKMIQEFLDERPMVSLFTRPRRFGKTLNMDMLRTYFEKSDEDTSIYFQDKYIWTCGEKYRAYQGKYPMIFVSFKDVKKETWEETYERLKQILILEFKRHRELETAADLSDYAYYHRVVQGDGTQDDMELALLMLSKMLHEYHGIAPMLIIDEYDTPIQQGYAKGFYDQVILFMRNLFSGGLKDNKHLSYGFLTGILRVAKESIFSGLNNLAINSILDKKYSSYFGFTAEEVRKMAHDYGMDHKYEEICQWYDGYRFGDTEIFNPWSVINFFRNDGQARAYWQSTGSNEIIGEILASADGETFTRLQSLLEGKPLMTYVDTSVIYPEIRRKPSSIYSFLLMAGYLKLQKANPSFGGDYMCQVALPNKEISFVYQKEILQKLEDMIYPSTSISIQEAVYMGDAERLKAQLATLLRQSVSYYDTAKETFYHGLMLGLCAMLDDRYEIRSNRESGDGRFDLQLLPKDQRFPGILIEMKVAESTENLESLAEAAVAQINSLQYDTELRSKGCSPILKYGVAFHKKNVEVKIREER